MGIFSAQSAENIPKPLIFTHFPWEGDQEYGRCHNSVITAKP